MGFPKLSYSGGGKHTVPEMSAHLTAAKVEEDPQLLAAISEDGDGSIHKKWLKLSFK